MNPTDKHKWLNYLDSKKKKQPKKNRKKQYQDYLKSNEWAQLKIDLFNYRGRSCEICGVNYSLQVHHLTYENIFNEEPEDLIILCKKCHQKQH